MNDDDVLDSCANPLDVFTIQDRTGMEIDEVERAIERLFSEGRIVCTIVVDHCGKQALFRRSRP